jgi:hypothetical protein
MEYARICDIWKVFIDYTKVLVQDGYYGGGGYDTF